MTSFGITMFAKLDDLLQKLKISNNSIIKSKIIDDNYYYFSKFFKNYQIGGGKVRHTNVKFKGFNFKINIIKDINMTTFSIIGDNDLDCVIFFINHGTDYAWIQTISNISGCIIEGQVYKRGGSILLQLIINFLKKYKKDLKIKRAVLTDNSFKYCHGKHIPLSRMYTLLTGHTWYGKYNFKPYNSKDEEPDLNLLELYENNHRIMKNAKVKDVKNFKDIIIKKFNKIKPKNINLTNILNAIDTMQDKKLTKFIKMFLKDYDKYCKLFKEIELDIYASLNLFNFHRQSFYLEL